ncbi:MAG: rhodanese-like domain-containing protein [bacterium]
MAANNHFLLTLNRACAIGVLALALGAILAAVVPLPFSAAEVVNPQPPAPPAPPLQGQTPPFNPPPPAPSAPGLLINLPQLRQLMAQEPVQFVDARSAADFAISCIPGAVHLSPDMFAGNLPPAALALDRSLPVVIYCTGGTCESSHLVAIRLGQLGLTRLHVYEDGFDGWRNAGLPMQSTPGVPQ